MYFTMTQEKIAEIAACEPELLTIPIAEDYALNYDWPEGEDHQAWLDESPAQEIADWICAGITNGESV